MKQYRYEFPKQCNFPSSIALFSRYKYCIISPLTSLFSRNTFTLTRKLSDKLPRKGLSRPSASGPPPSLYQTLFGLFLPPRLDPILGRSTSPTLKLRLFRLPLSLICSLNLLPFLLCIEDPNSSRTPSWSSEGPEVCWVYTTSYGNPTPGRLTSATILFSARAGAKFKLNGVGGRGGSKLIYTTSRSLSNGKLELVGIIPNANNSNSILL
jgi:hypothetical protein